MSVKRLCVYAFTDHIRVRWPLSVSHLCSAPRDGNAAGTHCETRANTRGHAHRHDSLYTYLHACQKLPVIPTIDEHLRAFKPDQCHVAHALSPHSSPASVAVGAAPSEHGVLRAVNPDPAPTRAQQNCRLGHPRSWVPRASCQGPPRAQRTQEPSRAAPSTTRTALLRRKGGAVYAAPTQYATWQFLLTDSDSTDSGPTLKSSFGGSSSAIETARSRVWMLLTEEHHLSKRHRHRIGSR